MDNFATDGSDTLRDIASELIDLVNSGGVFTDIHIETDRPVMLKTPGGWAEAQNIDALYTEDISAFLKNIDADWRENIKKNAISKAIDLQACRLRINAYRINGGASVAISIRRQPLSPMSLESTGLPQFIRPSLGSAKGLIVVSGQTGAGKTTTLASMVDYINSTRAAHIVTIEDPIEYVHDRKKSIVSHKEVPVDIDSFSTGLKEALRQKPDVILVGEIRDRETADVAMMAAESGHLVLCSLHTNSSVGAITKLLSLFPADEIHQRCRTLADALLMVVCQNLIASKDGESFVLAAEVLMNTTPQTAAMILDPVKHIQIADFMKRSPDQMSRSLNSELFRLVKNGLVSEKEAMRVTNDRMALSELINSAPMQR